MIAAVARAAAVLVPRYSPDLNAAPPAPAMMAARPVAVPEPAAADSRSVTVPRNSRGHFQVDARLDGRRLSFMVDTVASVIALTADDAATLGIHPSAREFTMIVKTPNAAVSPPPLERARVRNEHTTPR